MRFGERLFQRTGVLLRMMCVALVGCSAEPVDLQEYERQVFSQFGEDGVIEKIFEIIEPTHEYAVEFGAGNGILASNMRNLVVNHGWRSLQIEGSEVSSKALMKNYADYPQVKTLQAWVWPGNVEILFEEAGVPKDFDLLVIDIDSNDYYVWRAIQSFRPKVVMIEINPWFPPPQLMVIDFHPMNHFDRSDYYGASIQSLQKLGKKKGYELIHHVSGGPNILFVDKKYFSRFGIRDNSPTTLFKSPGPQMLKNRKRGPEPYMGRKHMRLKAREIPKRFILDR